MADETRWVPKTSGLNWEYGMANNPARARKNVGDIGPGEAMRAKGNFGAAPEVTVSRSRALKPTGGQYTLQRAKGRK